MTADPFALPTHGPDGTPISPLGTAHQPDDHWLEIEDSEMIPFEPEGPFIEDLLAARYLKLSGLVARHPFARLSEAHDLESKIQSSHDESLTEITMVVFNGKEYYAGTAELGTADWQDIDFGRMGWDEALAILDTAILPFLDHEGSTPQEAAYAACKESTDEPTRAARIGGLMGELKTILFSDEEVIISALMRIRESPDADELTLAVANLLGTAGHLVTEAIEAGAPLHSKQAQVASAIVNLAWAAL